MHSFFYRSWASAMTSTPLPDANSAQCACSQDSLASLFLPINSTALKNPMKGWRGQINRYYWGSQPVLDRVGGGSIPDSQPIWDVHESENLESIRKWYVHWDEIEAPGDDENAAIQRIKNYTDRHLSSMPARNMKAIPRLEIYTKEGPKTPNDLQPPQEIAVNGVSKRGDREHPWWEEPAVSSRLFRLIRRLGIVWDDDPRIAAVQVSYSC